MLSAFLLIMGLGTASARGGDSQESLDPAQSKTRITGTVIDQTGEPVIGAKTYAIAKMSMTRRGIS
ncbi:MAG: hypothetical protein LBS79_05885 [Tannerella sp.]|jgi:hypothetical protein|nr:hypothetical protein [Tannerella sp.]